MWGLEIFCLNKDYTFQVLNYQLLLTFLFLQQDVPLFIKFTFPILFNDMLIWSRVKHTWCISFVIIFHFFYDLILHFWNPLQACNRLGYLGSHSNGGKWKAWWTSHSCRYLRMEWTRGNWGISLRIFTNLLIILFFWRKISLLFVRYRGRM